MMGYIQGQAPDTKGKWDVAAIPGGGGNWGGSFLTIPKQGKNVDAAWEFIKWAVQPAQQITIFKNIGNLPSQPALYEDPAIVDFTNPFFSDAPVGQIFSDHGQEPDPAVPREEERAGPRLGGERPSQGRAGQDER